MRLFIALDIDEAIRHGIVRFVEGISGFAPEARWVRPESLHVTLKFIGEKPEELVDDIKRQLSGIRSEALPIRFRGTGFFPNPRAARVFWIGIDAGPQLGALARAVDDRMTALGIPKEEHAFSPHLTLARGKGGSGAPKLRKGDGPDRGFHRLQEKLSAMPSPDFGTMTAREFFLYRSQLSPAGSRYTKVERFALT